MIPLTERLADWLTGGEFTRTRIELDLCLNQIAADAVGKSRARHDRTLISDVALRRAGGHDDNTPTGAPA